MIAWVISWCIVEGYALDINHKHIDKSDLRWQSATLESNEPNAYINKRLPLW